VCIGVVQWSSSRELTSNSQLPCCRFDTHLVCCIDRKINTFDQWCLRTLLGIKWHQFVPEANETSKFSRIVQSHHRTFYGQIVHMDDNTDAKRILSTLPPEDWRRPRGRPRITWPSTIQQAPRSHNLTLPKLCNGSQNRSLWRMWSMHDVISGTQSWVVCQKRRRRSTATALTSLAVRNNAIFCSKAVCIYVCRSVQCLSPNDTFAAISRVTTGLISYSLPTCLHASRTNFIVLQRHTQFTSQVAFCSDASNR